MIQRFAEIVGKTGCYFLCLVKLCEYLTARSIDALISYKVCVDMAFMRADCWIWHPDKILSFLGVDEWEFTHEDADYELRPGELCIDRYELKTTMNVLSHFIIPKQGNIDYYDPYGDSKTVREGALVSKRVFRRVIR